MRLRCSGFGRFRSGGDANLQRIDPDRPFDVLEFGLAEIGDIHIEPTAHLPIGVLGEADRAWLRDAFQPRGHVHSVAHQIAIAFFDDVTQVYADPELDAALRRQARIAFDHAVLHLDGAAHGVNHAAKLDEAAVASPLDDASVMQGDGRVEQVAAQRPEARERAISSAPASRL